MSTNEKPSQVLIDLADRLYKSGIPGYFGSKDVLTWYSNEGIAVAFKGNALRMELVCFGEKTVKNRRGESETHFETTGNVIHILTRIVQVLGLNIDTSHFDDNYDHISSVRDNIQNIIYDYLVENKMSDFGDVRFTLIPLEGNPWNIGTSVTYYYSASKGKILEGKSPDNTYLVELKDEVGKFMAIDVCAVLPTFIAQKGAIVGILQDGTEIFVSHTFSPEKQEQDNISSEIKKCGGLIFPSLALSPLAANTFGKITLVSYLDFILSGMRPYKTKKGAWQVTIYDTDAWTGRTSYFLHEGATELFDQLTGNWTIPTYSNEMHFLVLGPQITEGPAEARPISDTKKLQSVLKKITKVWNRNAEEKQLSIAIEKNKKNAYPYLEAKINGVYSLTSFPLAVVEKNEYNNSKKLLQSMGWSGDLIIIDELSGTYYQQNPIGGFSSDILRYSWLLHDAVVEYADSKRAIERILV